MLKRIDAEIAYANAPWVPLQIEAGNLGTTSLMGSQPKTVKKGYSFNLTFQPSKDYPFAGWQAWTIDEGIIATWRSSENQTNTDKVKFVPKNAEGTQVEIFVYVLPSNGAQLFIGPWGATADNLSVLLRIQPAWGTSNPPAGNLTNPVPKPGIPFLINYFPSAEFEFKEWEAEYQDENNIWKITNDDSIVKFEDPGSPITSVIINTTAPVRLRPNVQERPFIESTNIVFGRQEYTDFNVMINFSDRMIKETLNWDTISISINNNVIDKEKARATFRFSSNPEDEFAELSDGDRLLIFRPDGDLVPPNARIEITFKQEKEDGSAGVQSVGGTSLTRDIIIRYNCGPGKSPKKPMFAGNAKFALRNGSAWTFWEGDAATYNGSTGRIPFIGVVMIAFLPEDDTEVVAVRITETLIRLPGDSEDLSPSLELQFSPTTINITGSYYQDPVADQFNNKRFIAIPYTPQLPNVSENYSTFFGLRFKIELFDGVNWSDNITGVQEGFQSIRTKYDLVQIHPLRDVTGATVNSTYERGNFSGFGPAASATSTSQVKINNDIVFSNSVTQFLTVGGAHCQMFPAPFTSGYNDTFGSTPINSSRSVTIPNYRLGEIPVTEKLWHDVRDWAVIREYVFVNNGSTIGDNFPVTNISWQDVIVWCNALSEICGLDPVYRDGSNNVIKNANSVLNTYTMPLDWQERNGFRLPVDAEWDYAARGGNITTAQNGTPWNFTYSGSSNPATVANFSGSISQVKGTRTANNLGLFDMSGNVNEWVWDRNGDILTTTPFTGPASGNNRIIRGGHFSTTGNSQRLGDARGNAAITTQNATTGFRVARSGD